MSRTLFHTRLFIVLVLLSLPLTRAMGQRLFAKAQAVDEAVIGEMQRQRVVGVAIGIIRDSKIVYTKGYGIADLKSRTPVSDETVFNWASNSKPVIAVAALQLVQHGQLDLDEPIRTYLPLLPDHLKTITTRQLLSHQSGIPHYSNGKVVPSGENVDRRMELDPLISLHRFMMSPLLFAPGSRTEYSSYAYVLLTAVVQAAGKKPIGQQLSERIEKPMGLKTFQLDVPFNGQRNWVTAYKIVDGTPTEVADYAHFWKHGAGGYKSSVKDFARFAVALVNRELIDAKTSSRMWTPQKTSNGKTSNYGLGVAVSVRGKNLMVSHSGSQNETRTQMVVYPKQKHGVVVMCNTQDCEPGRISTTIYAAMNKR